ncbi:FecR family protein [Paraflavitalea pollutisoli]|uniref:FecR family protein n=1 Tax=Paraflavitalea pollutisoli TaxID=3034143 RepID=UPI0023EBB2B9|nr:FecR domain-containing protein [Paraflavitalea sp. H1-2-19X]
MNTHFTVEELVCDVSFQRYCRGDDALAVAQWTAWIEAHPAQQDLVEEARQLLSILNARQGNVQEQRGQLADGIDRYDLLKQSLADQPTATILPARRRWKYVSVVAAAALLLAVAGYYWYLAFLPTKISPPAVVRAVDPVVELRSGDEPRKTVVLPDGSVVTLRSHSSLTLLAGFNQSTRELSLTGEAFFDVTHHVDRPFIVHTRAANIEVLGTVFNVRAYPSQEHVETALFRGKVVVSLKDHPEQQVVLAPSMKAIVSDKGGLQVDGGHKATVHVLKLSPDPVSHKAQEIEWLRNRLRIEDEPLSAIAVKLQDWYGIQISFADEAVKSYRYTGTFESETVVKALEALQLSYPFSFQVDKEKIIISK